MKSLIIAGLMICAGHLVAQTKIEKKVVVRAGQTLQMNFEDPELIKVRTWDKQEVFIKGSVSINRGEHDGAFEITSDQRDNVLVISSRIKDRDNIPKRTVIHKGDQDYYFQTGDPNDPAIQKFFSEHGREYSFMSNGIIRNISLEVFVPRGMASSLEAKFGLVEVADFEGPLTVNATFGGVDATVVAARTGELIARTHFGEILTNLDAPFTPIGKSNDSHWTEIRANPGTGPSYQFESKFGKLYLRKP